MNAYARVLNQCDCASSFGWRARSASSDADKEFSTRCPGLMYECPVAFGLLPRQKSSPSVVSTNTNWWWMR